MVMTRRRYALHMKDNLPTIEGLLVGRRSRCFELINAQILEGVDRTITIAGRIEVPRENVYCLERIE